MNEVTSLDPSFFLLTNKNVYYTWHLPVGVRTSLLVLSDGYELRSEDGHPIDRVYKGNMPSDILGIRVTGYQVGQSYVLDTMYDLRDPYTEEEVDPEIGRGSSLRSFVDSFNNAATGLTMLTQTLYGINLSLWDAYIDRIWADRVKRPYPIVGLVFYSRTSEEVKIWHYHPTVTGEDGVRYTLPDLGSGVEECRPISLKEEDLGWEDLAGAGVTTMLWYIRRRWGEVSRNDIANVVQSLTTEQRTEIANNILLSPRQLAYLGL
jgi:hypothetical protein